MNPLKQAYMEEAKELLDSLEQDFIALETNADDNELIHKVFRELHTVKGSGGMFGFERLSKFVHDLETLYDLIRNDKLLLTQEIVSLSLKFVDFCQFLLNEPDENESVDLEQQLIESLHDLIPPVTDEPRKKSKPVGNESISLKQKLYRIQFIPDKDIFVKGINVSIIYNNLSSLGRCFSFAHEENIPEINDINPEFCYTGWTFILTTSESINTIKDIFIFVEDSCKLTITEIFSSIAEIEDETMPLIGDILLSTGNITKEAIEQLVNKRKLFGSEAVEMGFTTEDKVASALFEQKTIANVKKEVSSTIATSSIRVQNEKLDFLTNTVSELVTLQARLTQFAEAQKQTELTSISEYLEKLTSSLRDTVMMIRMVPVEDGFTSMHRLVRDLSKELQKDVKLTITGGDTELDKTIIDTLKDPMLHLIRNCIDHGIEQPQERAALGKPEKGSITINAEHTGSHVIISVIDDGRGLDRDTIAKKAIDKSLVTTIENLSDAEIYQFIFLPGFSTAEITTNISGRGVGMDVVKKNIESVRGEVFIETERGKGTTIRMKLPITLAIIDGLLFTVGNELFVVNIASVSECLELTQEIMNSAGGKNILKLRDIIVPFIYLRDILNIQGNSPEHEQIIIINTHDYTIGFVVDTVEGKHQTVVKTTGRLFSNVKEVTGATILGDGRIALILDPNFLAQKASKIFMSSM